MYFVRVRNELADRIDAEFYNPVALQTLELLERNGPLKTLGAAIAEGYRVVYHGIDPCPPGAPAVLFLSPTQIDEDGGVSLESAPSVPAYYQQRYAKGLAAAGELLVEVKGNATKVAVVPEDFPQGLMISGSLYKASIRADVDSRFILAFLRCRYGQVLKTRLTSNTIIDYIAKDALYSIPLPKAGSATQRYIGDKVRQAERLRERARRLEAAVATTHAQYIVPPTGIEFAKRTRRLAARSLTERLDAHFYPSAVEQYFRQLGGPTRSLDSLSSLVVNGQSQPEAEEGVRQATVTNLGRSFVEGSLRTVERPADGSRALAHHDLLLCNAAHNKSYIGRDVTYSQLAGAYPSTEVMVVRVDRTHLPASFVRHYLKTEIGYLQIQSTIRGITAHSYPTDVKLLEIPIPAVADVDREAWFATDDLMLAAGRCFDAAKVLTSVATTLVEHLIDGRITEGDLVAAQKAPEAGERSADREIVKALRQSAAPDAKPLIADLDSLYALLDAQKEEAAR